MYFLLLTIIMMAFTSLGLPSALLGAAWPTMYKTLNVPISYMGIITTIIATTTVLASLRSDYLTKKYGSNLTIVCAMTITAGSLWGFSLSHSFLITCLYAIPLGLGTGITYVGINNYVALYYEAHHMRWLHLSWGFGASIGPYIMMVSLNHLDSWNNGYKIVSGIQIAVAFCVFLSLPIWKKRPRLQKITILKVRDMLRIRGVINMLFILFFLCSIEYTIKSWTSTYIIGRYGINIDLSSGHSSAMYIGITIRRFTLNFLSKKSMGYKNLVRSSILIMFVGIVLINFKVWCILGFIIIGLGLAPILPAIIHYTPNNFGKEYSGAIIGLEIASTYVGGIFAPAIFGIMLEHFKIEIYPIYLLVLTFLMLLACEKFNYIQKKYSKYSS
ncbi:hypothetical protein AN396_09545 [Candidatus Epulonipiscium fishelsonii]|uniref:Uncharacterized protein n=1 Tax=Candidatus Epulonipiscium fishelsonii TaxID=77094 RepID=A0ACC8XA19_9FIRM|nr:hypothetical protein AN396_09545 [Epulopiscium sp. SCG-B11WGA-EpuloA1]